jgi:glutathione peroxidase
MGSKIIARMLSIVAGAVGLGTGTALAQDTTAPKTAYTSIYEIPVEPMKAEGGATGTSLAQYKGKVLLIVNVASKCGYTPQYTGLEALYRKYKDQGLVVVGFPSNDFKEQEPGTEQEIVQFCKTKYDVTFPLYAKVKVKGADKAALYRYLTEGDHAGKAEVGWNFNKYLVGRDGKVIAHYDSKVKPDDAALTAEIEKQLAAK